MQKKSKTAKIRLNIKTVGGKEIELNGRKITIPTLTFYHRKFFNENDTTFDYLSKITKSICNDLTRSEVEYVIIQLLIHNKKLPVKYKNKHGETFDSKNIELIEKNEFEYKGKVYKFNKIDSYFSIDDIDDTLLGYANKQLINSDIDFTAEDSDPNFYAMAMAYYRTIKITGDKGTTFYGIADIISALDGEL